MLSLRYTPVLGGSSALRRAASVIGLAPSGGWRKAHGAQVFFCLSADCVVLGFIVQLREKHWDFDKYVGFIVHERFVATDVMMIVVTDVKRKAGIDESKDVNQDEVLEGWGEFFIPGQPFILPANLVTAFLEVGDEEITVFVVEAHDAGSGLVAEIQ